MRLGIYLLLPFWAGYTKRLGVIQGNKSNKEKRYIKNYFCIFNFEEYLKLTMYVARRESIKKNNKLSKVDWGITISSTKNDISLKKRIQKKKSTLSSIFILKLINLIYFIKSLRFRLILIWKIFFSSPKGFYCSFIIKTF